MIFQISNLFLKFFEMLNVILRYPYEIYNILLALTLAITSQYIYNYDIIEYSMKYFLSNKIEYRIRTIILNACRHLKLKL